MSQDAELAGCLVMRKHVHCGHKDCYWVTFGGMPSALRTMVCARMAVRVDIAAYRWGRRMWRWGACRMYDREEY